MQKQEIRAEIDALDAQITALFCRRMALCRQIGGIKQTEGLPLQDSVREAEVLANVAAQAGDEMEEYAVWLYREIFILSREFQTVNGEK